MTAMPSARPSQTKVPRWSSPSTRSRKTHIPYDRQAYRARNLVERLWCRLKDWRCIATRYDKLAANYMAGVFLAAIES